VNTLPVSVSSRLAADTGSPGWVAGQAPASQRLWIAKESTNISRCRSYACVAYPAGHDQPPADLLALRGEGEQG